MEHGMVKGRFQNSHLLMGRSAESKKRPEDSTQGKISWQVGAALLGALLFRLPLSPVAPAIDAG